MPLTIGPNGEWIYSEEPTYPAQTAAPAPAPAPVAQPAAQVTTAPAPRDTSAIEALYQQNLGRAADAEGLQYWANSGLTPEQISAYMQQSDEYRARQAPAPSFGAQTANPFAATQAQTTSASVQTAAPANPYAFYDTPQRISDNVYRLSDAFGAEVMPDGRLSNLTYYDPKTGQALTNASLDPRSVLSTFDRLNEQYYGGAGLDAFAGLNAALDKIGINSRPGQMYSGSDAGIDFDALARGQLGTSYDWTSDANVGFKGPTALRQLQESQELAQKYGIQGANTGLVGNTAIPQFNSAAIGGGSPGNVRQYNPEVFGADRAAYAGGAASAMNPFTAQAASVQLEKRQGAPAGVDAGTVNALYQYALGRQADPEGLQYWANSGLTPEQILGYLQTSPEAQARSPGVQSPFAAQTTAGAQGAVSTQPATPGVDPSLFINRLSAQLGRLDEQELAPFQSQLVSAIQEFPNRPRGDINYDFQRIAGTSADDQYLDTGTFESSGGAPNIPGLSDREAAYATFLVNSNASVRGTTPANAPLKLLDAGFSADDVRNILGTLGVGESAGSIDEAIADAAARDFMKQTGLKPDTGSFGSFIKDAFQSPVGAFILAGLTGGLGGFGAIGSGLTGGALQAGSAGAAALGGGAIGAGRAALTGGNILKDGAIGALTAGLGSAYGGDVLDAIKGGASSLAGALPSGLTDALSGAGDFLSGVGGDSSNPFEGFDFPTDLEYVAPTSADVLQNIGSSGGLLSDYQFPTDLEYVAPDSLDVLRSQSAAREAFLGGRSVSDLSSSELQQFNRLYSSGAVIPATSVPTSDLFYPDVGASPVGTGSPFDLPPNAGPSPGLSDLPTQEIGGAAVAPATPQAASDFAEDTFADVFREQVAGGATQIDALQAAQQAYQDALTSALAGGISSLPRPSGSLNLPQGPVLSDTVTPGSGERPVAEVTPNEDPVNVTVSSPPSGGSTPASGSGAPATPVQGVPLPPIGGSSGGSNPYSNDNDLPPNAGPQPPSTTRPNLTLPQILQLLGLGSSLLGALGGARPSSGGGGGISTLQRGPNRYGLVRQEGTTAADGKYVPTDYYTRDRIPLP